MLGDVFERVVAKSPISVMVRGPLERVLGADQLDLWYERTAKKPYTRELLFSTVYDLMSHVVCRIKPSVPAAYRDHHAEVGTSIVSVSNTLNGWETHTSAALVRSRARVFTPLIEQGGGERAPWLPGSRVQRVDGHGLEATARRLKALRDVHAAAWPGKSLVVYEPAQGVVTHVFPCADGHAQERSWCGAVRNTVQAGDLWMEDRHVCTREFLGTIDRRGAFFLTRQQAGLPCDMVTPLRAVGRMETGPVAAPQVRVVEAQGEAHGFRRLQMPWHEATRDGDRLLSLLTHVPSRHVSTKRVARFSRKRWTLETACQPLEASVHAEIKTLGSPKAALCGLCLALVAANVFAVVWAAWRGVHGESTVEHEVAGSSVANDIAATSKGMMIAIPEPAW